MLEEGGAEGCDRVARTGCSHPCEHPLHERRVGDRLLCGDHQQVQVDVTQAVCAGATQQFLFGESLVLADGTPAVGLRVADGAVERLQHDLVVGRPQRLRNQLPLVSHPGHRAKSRARPVQRDEASSRRSRTRGVVGAAGRYRTVSARSLETSAYRRRLGAARLLDGGQRLVVGSVELLSGWRTRRGQPQLRPRSPPR